MTVENTTPSVHIERGVVTGGTTVLHRPRQQVPWTTYSQKDLLIVSCGCFHRARYLVFYFCKRRKLVKVPPGGTFIISLLVHSSY